MESDIPKQFLQLEGKPVLLHTLQVFESIGGIEIILVLPELQIAYWEKLLSEGGYPLNGRVVKGGETRFHSVKNGLLSIPEEEKALVMVHDGVRPLISSDLIEKSFQEAEKFGSAVTAVSLKDSIRKVKSGGGSVPVERTSFRLVQTPQTFQIQWMKAAFNAEYQPFFTDCASVVEHAGFKVHLIEGDYKNLKITTPEDLVLAEALLRAKNNA